MKKISVAALALTLMAISLTGCEAIAGIFKAGIWVGVVAVLAVIAIIIFIFAKAGGK